MSPTTRTTRRAATCWPICPTTRPGRRSCCTRQAAEARALSRCVQGLSAEQQQCVALAYYQGLSHAEVAEHLAQPLGTVKSWVRRALLALKDCLGHAVARER